MTNTGRGLGRNAKGMAPRARKARPAEFLAQGDLAAWSDHEVQRSASKLTQIEAALDEEVQKLCDGKKGDEGEEVDERRLNMLFKARQVYLGAWKDAAKLKAERGEQVALSDEEQQRFGPLVGS